MKRFVGLVTLVLLSWSPLATAATTRAAALEKWADQGLPVTDGLVLWLDATRQPAAAKANGETIGENEPLATWYDGSGQRRHVIQPDLAARPTFTPSAIRFDGKDDHLLSVRPAAAPLRAMTAVLIAAPRANPGGFRGFLAAAAIGKSDYRSGFTLDMGPDRSGGIRGFDNFNVEGHGFGGAMNLFDQAAVPFAQPQSIIVTVAASGEGAVKTYLHGRLTGERARTAEPLAMQQLLVGARSHGPEPHPPTPRSFLDGDIVEVLLYDRVLTDAERAALEEHLANKHPALAESALAAAEASQSGTAPLQRVENPPVVQMLVPGFTAHELPVDLTNINNVRYREDGKLVALAYDGKVYLLSDTDGDGLEDTADLFWANIAAGGDPIRQPIGMALTPPDYPHGCGLFVAGKGKLSLIVDTDGDDKADREIVVASGWPASFVQVDAIGVAIDPRDQSIYFGLGTPNFADPYMPGADGRARFDGKGERGTILRVAPDLKSREIVCTGIRFSVGLAFNAAGDLFATDQEGATWAPNGNPFDELLHIQPGRHYGFPARHPKHLPNVIDEPSTFDYAPQHQSTCGIVFNEPVNGGRTFGPDHWRGDALICGESRGKLYRTKLVKTPSGYVASNQIIASVSKILIDATVTPRGDLVLCTHSGNPDWGSGPTGKGKLYQIRYVDRAAPQPVAAWPAGPGEVRVAFDKPIHPAMLAGIAKNVTIDAGRYVAAGDRFEAIRPGYAIVKRQLRAARDRVPVGSVQVTSDRRTLVIGTSSERRAIGYGITLPRPETPSNGIPQHPQIDLAYDLTGVIAEWKSAHGKSSWSGWLPHPDLEVARALTVGSAEHDGLWALLQTPGTLTIRGSLNLRNMLQPAVQPGSTIDFTPAQEVVTVSFESQSPLELRVRGQKRPDGKVKASPKPDEWVPVEIVLATSTAVKPSLSVSFTTQEDDDTPRPLALHRFYVPWARPVATEEHELAAREPIPQLAGGDWHQGRKLFFGNEAGCAKCHIVRGQGSDIGPDLSNLVHRDYESVLRDIRDPSGAQNPDHIASLVALKDGRVLSGIVRDVGPDTFLVRGDAEGEKAPLSRALVKKISASPISMMPTGLAEGLGEAKMRDLLTFLLTEPLTPAPIQRKGAPPPRSRAEVEAVLKNSSNTPAGADKRLRILLVAGPKDHGPSEHDYPDWQKRWTTLLGLAENVTVAQASEWPTAAQWSACDVAVFYSANPQWAEHKGAELDAHLARGGGLVFLHMAVHGHQAPAALAERIGLAWGPGAKFRHGALDLLIRDPSHPITRGFQNVSFIDESYWNLTGQVKRIHLLADAVEEGAPRPLLWTHGHGGGRVFVSILGHYTWTFDDPLFRLLVLRGICWTAGQEADRLSGLATVGARVR